MSNPRMHLLKSVRQALEDDMQELHEWPMGEPLEIELETVSGGIMKQRWESVLELIEYVRPAYEALREAIEDLEREFGE